MSQNTKAVIIQEFIQVANKNVDSKGELVETLAFLFGFDNGKIIEATELLFPNQSGDASKVIDNGKLKIC
jgi:hypothetical protein